MSHNQSFSSPAFCLDIPLDPALPIVGGEPSIQGDLPITQLHWHPCLELGYCHSGNGVFVVADKILPFESGDVVFINWREPHLARSSPGTCSHWTWIYLDPLRLVQHADVSPSVLDASPYCGPAFGNVIRAAENPYACHLVERMATELQHRQVQWQAVIRALTVELMVAMVREFGSFSGKNGAIRPRSTAGAALLPSGGTAIGRMAPALDRLARSPASPPSVKEMAALCAMSEAQFRRCFRSALGKAPLEYSHDFRLGLAAGMLTSTELSVLQVALETGFKVPSSFTRAFARAYGTPPASWRAGRRSRG